MEIKQPEHLIQSGFSRRWHSNPDMADKPDDLAQHQWSVAMLVLTLKPDCSKELLVEALTHDVGEYVAGDLAYDFKINNPEIAAMHKVSEEEARAEIITTDKVSHEELQVLKLADWLSSYVWVAKNNPALLWRTDWVEQADYFLSILSYKQRQRLSGFFDLISSYRDKGHGLKIDLGYKFGKGLQEYEAAS